jgi:hypothetical protein
MYMSHSYLRVVGIVVLSSAVEIFIAVLNYQQRLFSLGCTDSWSGVAGYELRDLLPSFCQVPGDVQKDVQAPCTMPAGALPARATFSAHGALAFLLCIASDQWAAATGERHRTLCNLFADQADAQNDSVSYSLVAMLFDTAFGSGTVADFWDMWGWPGESFIRGGWPWQAEAPQETKDQSTAAEVASWLEEEQKRIGQPQPAPARKRILHAHPVAGSAAHLSIRSLYGADGDMGQGQGARVHAAPISLRALPPSDFKLTADEENGVEIALKSNPTFQYRKLPPLGSSEKPSQILSLSQQFTFAMRPQTLKGHSPFWYESRLYVVQQVAKMLDVPPDALLREFDFRSPELQGARMEDLPDFCTENPIYQRISEACATVLSNLSPKFSHHLLLLEGGPGAGKSFNLRASVASGRSRLRHRCVSSRCSPLTFLSSRTRVCCSPCVQLCCTQWAAVQDSRVGRYQGQDVRRSRAKASSCHLGHLRRLACHAHHRRGGRDVRHGGECARRLAGGWSCSRGAPLRCHAVSARQQHE